MARARWKGGMICAGTNSKQEPQPMRQLPSHTHAQGGCPVTDTLTCHKLLVPLAQKRPGHLHPPDPPALQPAVASLILPCLPPNNA